MSEVYRIQPTSLSGANSFLHRAFLKRGCVQAEMYAGRPGPCKAVRVLYTVIKPPSGSMHARQASSIKRKDAQGGDTNIRGSQRRRGVPGGRICWGNAC